LDRSRPEQGQRELSELEDCRHRFSGSWSHKRKRAVNVGFEQRQANDRGQGICRTAKCRKYGDTHPSLNHSDHGRGLINLYRRLLENNSVERSVGIGAEHRAPPHEDHPLICKLCGLDTRLQRQGMACWNEYAHAIQQERQRRSRKCVSAVRNDRQVTFAS